MKLLGKDVPKEEFDFLMCEHSQGKDLKVVGGKVVAVEREVLEEERIRMRICELKEKLRETDYKVLKWKENELTDEEFEPIRLQRMEWRKEIRLLGG